jgi:hypothetical protein
MNICLECGRVFEGDGVTVSFALDDISTIVSETVCPFCRCEYEEAEKCIYCGEYAPKSQMKSGFCEECSYNADVFDDLIKVCENEGEKSSVNVNTSLIYLFSEDEINTILLDAARSREARERKKKACREFICDCGDFLADHLGKED